jgi:hypothetical protein
MSLATIARAAKDPDLMDRVSSSANQEANNNPDLHDTLYAQQLRSGVQSVQPLMWSVAVDTEASYASALANGRGAPGHDEDVITDAQITASVVAHWPPDPAP